MKAYSVREASVLSACLEYLAASGITAWRMNTGAGKLQNGQYVKFGYPGMSDIVGILPGGRFLAVECKRPVGGRVRPDQAAFLQSVKEAGGTALVVRSLDELILGLAAEKRG